MTPQRCKWFTGRGKVGIVQAHDEKGNNHYFIGIGDGLNETIDVNLIISFGAVFPKSLGDQLFPEGVRGVEKRSTRTARVSTVATKRRTASSKPSRPTTRRK
jgi:hypothetical protein